MPVFVVEGAPSAIVAGVRGVVSFRPAVGEGGFAVYEGADQAALREAIGAGGAIWAAVNLSPSSPGAGRDVYVVEERFDPPIDLSKAAPEDPRLSPCLQRNDVDWVTSFIAADGTQCRCVYDAADAEAVRASYRAAKMPFVKVWRASRVQL